MLLFIYNIQTVQWVCLKGTDMFINDSIGSNAAVIDALISKMILLKNSKKTFMSTFDFVISVYTVDYYV